MTEEGRVREVKNELLSYDDSMEFANFFKKNWYLLRHIGEFSFCKRELFGYYQTMKNTLKRFAILLAKVITIFFTVLSFALLVLTFAKPEWIKSGIEWI